MLCKPPDDTDSQLSVLEHLIIQRNEQAADIFSLSKVSIELFVEILQDCAAYRWICKISAWKSSLKRKILTRIGNANREELFEHITDNLNRMTTRLMTDWVIDEELG